MIEFTIVGPIITLLGLAILQYGMLFFAKNQFNHAAFMAARAGAMAHADLAAVRAAYARALVPLYGGGTTPVELAASLARAQADMGNASIELLNPTRESFADWNDADLQARLNTGGKRVIPNTHLAVSKQQVGVGSGQTLQDANLIKLRITHGYLPKVPLVRKLYPVYLRWLDTGDDPFYSAMVAAGRIPVVTHATLHMQSEAIEPERGVSRPGSGDGAPAIDPGQHGGVATPAPRCQTLACPVSPPSQPPPPSQPACNPLTDPKRCMDSVCGAATCCASA